MKEFTDYFDRIVPVRDGFSEEDVKALKVKYPNLVFELVDTTVGTRLRICGNTTNTIMEQIEQEVL